MAHEQHRLLAARPVADPLHEIDRCSVGTQHGLNDLAVLRAYFERVAMTAEDQRVAALAANQCFEDQRGDGICHADQAENNPNRTGNLGHAMLLLGF